LWVGGFVDASATDRKTGRAEVVRRKIAAAATGFYHEIATFWWNPADSKLVKGVCMVVKYYLCVFFMKPSPGKLHPR
jgi:hypothetical protein